MNMEENGRRENGGKRGNGERKERVKERYTIHIFPTFLFHSSISFFFQFVSLTFSQNNSLPLPSSHTLIPLPPAPFPLPLYTVTHTLVSAPPHPPSLSDVHCICLSVILSVSVYVPFSFHLYHCFPWSSTLSHSLPRSLYI